MKSYIEPRHLKGFKDFLPNQARIKAQIISKIRSNAYICGFLPIETPCLEYIESLLGEGGETEKEIYRLEDHGGRKLGLRFDLTMPFSRYVAEHQGELLFPFKRLEIAEVCRREKPQKGRQRQFCQGDLDIIGVDSIGADIEILYSLSLILSCILPSEPLSMYLGNRVILSGLIKYCFKNRVKSVDFNKSDEFKEFETRVLIILDKLKKIGLQNTLSMLEEYTSDSTGSSDLLSLITQDANNSMDKIEEFFKTNLETSEYLEELSRMKTILNTVSGFGFESIKYKIDFSIARGLGYYTGVVFETCIDRLESFGSVSSGGRYNNLVQRFLKNSLPGVGGSIGVDRIIQAIEELKLLDESRNIDVYIALVSEEQREYGMNLCARLRASGIKTDINLYATKLANQFKDSSRKKSLYTITVGEGEILEGKLNVKNMSTSQEERLTPDELVAKMCKECGGK